MTDPKSPLFTHIEPGPRLKASDVGKRLAQHPETPETATKQFRNFVMRDLVHVRDRIGTGRTSHNLFAWSDIATAKVIRSLMSMGLSDQSVMQQASLACYAWQGEHAKSYGGKFPATHPILAAIRGLSIGQHWQVRMDFWTNTKTGQRRLVARVYDVNVTQFPAVGKGYEHTSTITLPLSNFPQEVILPGDEGGTPN